MALSNRDRVGRAFELLATGLGPYVDRRMRARSPYKDRWFAEWASRERGEASLQDPSLLLKVMADSWDLAFREELRRSDRNVVFELRDVRNRWAHNESFTFDDTYRALDSIERLLVAVDASEAADAGKAKDELMRLRFDAEARKAQPKTSAVVGGPAAGLKPWREVAVPHDDVARGRFALAEFAADLHQVRHGEGSAEYVDPVEFFRRTYLTSGLRSLLTEAMQRLSGGGGVPVVDLQTTFGGGKTHSQIALWQLFSGLALDAFPQEVQDLASAAGVASLPSVRRAALVGTKIAPGQPSIKDDGTEVRTLWGELAWQLGGAEGFALVADADRTGTNPGDNLNALLARYAPCLVLVDEWVAYARQLYAADETLPAGSFEAQASFAQALTEAARAVQGAMLVVSLPASELIDEVGSGSDIELVGPGGREALRRLRAVVGRMESSWRPASAEESFEIVRRRLFQPIDAAALADRDATAQAFGDLYRRSASEFPAECREPAYVEQLKRAYPIHPELFARLYEDWSSLERFQRTRGVLRLMAAVINALWEAGDQSPLIMPATVPLSEATVAAELTRNLEDSWKPVIDADIDGATSLPASLDRELAGTLGRFQAARRVARAVFIGSAPTIRSPNRGIDAARVRLGCVLPGEQIATFGDALNRLSARSTYLYSEGGRYWFGVQPSVARVARDRADRYLSEALDDVHAEIVRRIREAGRDAGELRGVHPAPASSGDVPDDPAARLVVLPPDRPHIARSEESQALAAAADVLQNRGGTPREFRNVLVFLAADHRRLEDLERGVAEFLAWSSVVDDAGADGLSLDPNQTKQATTKRDESNRTVDLRMAETYQWLLVPAQVDHTAPVTWDVVKVDGQDGLIARAARKLVNDGHLYVSFPPTLLRQRLTSELKALWDGGHTTVAAVWDAFARYVYLPRLRDIDVLLRCVANGPASTVWQDEAFTTADAVEGDRYLGLNPGGHATVSTSTLIVRPDRAKEQLDRQERGRDGGDAGERGEEEEDARGGDGKEDKTGSGRPVRFHGVVRLDPERLSRDFGKVATEVVSHLSSLLGTDVEVTVEIAARNDEGFPDTAVRNVSENAKTLKFDDFGFEER